MPIIIDKYFPFAIGTKWIIMGHKQKKEEIMASMLERFKTIKQPKKTMSEHAEDALYREIGEEVQTQEMYDFIKKYARILIAGAIVIVICVAGWQLFRAHRESSRMTSATAYETAVNMAHNNPGAAGEALARAAKSGSGGMADLALFDSARIDLQMGNRAAAEKSLEQLAKNGATVDFRHLATIYLAIMRADSMTPREFEKFLAPLQTKRSPFYYTGLLMIAQIYLSVADEDNARIWLDKIIMDADAPRVIAAEAEALR